MDANNNAHERKPLDEVTPIPDYDQDHFKDVIGQPGPILFNSKLQLDSIFSGFRESKLEELVNAELEIAAAEEEVSLTESEVFAVLERAIAAKKRRADASRHLRLLRKNIFNN